MEAVVRSVERGSEKLSALAELVAESVRGGTPVVVEAYPGFGKTRLAASLLAVFERVAVLTRTHNEMFEVFRFMPRVGGARYAYGRPKICPKLSRFSYTVCRGFRVLRRCNTKVSRRHVAWLAATFRRPSEVREYGRRTGVCPYSALQVLVRSAKRLVATYDYAVSNPGILSGRDAVIMDEAQHLLSYLDDMVVRVDEAFIEALVGMLKAEARPLAYAVRSVYRRARGPFDFMERVNAVLASYSGPGGEAVELLDRLVSSYYSGRYKRVGGSLMILIDPLPRIARMENKVMLGAFLPPFFMARKAKVVRISGKPRVEALIDDTVSTRYEERGEETYHALAEAVARHVDDDVVNLVVFPSREVMDNVLGLLPSRVAERMVFAEEPPSGLPKGSVIIDVAGGRLSEGVNIPDVGNVVVAGMPFPQPDPKLDLLSKIYGFENTYTYIALMRTFQAVGRIRGSGRAVLVDSRFKKYVPLFPSWVSVTG